MREALRNAPENTMNRPDGIVDLLIDKATGETATPGDPNAVFEYFRNENAPEPAETQLPGLDIDEEGEEQLSTEIIF